MTLHEAPSLFCSWSQGEESRQGAVGIVLSALGCWDLRKGDSPAGADTNTRSWTPAEVTSLPRLQLKLGLMEELQEASPWGLGFIPAGRTAELILSGGGFQQEIDLSGLWLFQA